jgi:D-alanine-D-alanine ligase
VEAIESSLRSLEYLSVRIPFTRDVESFIVRMNDDGVNIAFNLCETVDEDPRLAWHPAAVLELLGIPFSGSPSPALMLTTDKVITKQLLKGHGIKTSDYLVYSHPGALDPIALRFPVIVKPRFEDASIGIDQESIFEEEGLLQNGLEELRARFGPLLVEEYIAGREFNISLFGYPETKVLPAAEIDFSAFPKDLYPIVGYRAKWEKTSFEYHNTPRFFPEGLSKVLMKEIASTALECFRLFLLRDYGRIDIRVDNMGNIYVLEINANPCLSPDAGFAAAAEKAGISYTSMVDQLLSFMVRRSENHDH